MDRLNDLFQVLRAPFSWQRLENGPVWKRYENDITGQRYSVWCGGGYQPFPDGWLRSGDVVYGRFGREVVV